MASALTNAGWVDLTHQKAELKVASRTIALAGTDDPHLRKASRQMSSDCGCWPA